MQGDAVVVLARLELVGQRHGGLADDQLIRIALGRQLVGLVEQDVAERQLEDARVAGLGVAPPVLEGLGADHRRRQPLVEELAQLVLVGEHVAAPRLIAQPLDLVLQLAVVLHERALADVLAADQRVGDEHLAAQFRIVLGVGDLAILDDGQAVQGHLLLGHDLALLLLPVRVAVAALAQLAAGGLEPQRIDLGDAAREQLRGLDQLGGHHPRRRLLGQARRRVDHELGLPRAEVAPRLLVPHPDPAEQPGQQRAVDLIGGPRLGVGRDVELLHHPDQLLVDVLPLAHPVVVEEVLATQLVHLVARALAARVLPEGPQLQVAGEVRALVAELAVGLVGLLLHVARPVARILQAERRGDHDDLAQRALVAAAEDHPAEPRIDRQPAELMAQLGQRAVLVDRAELLERAVALLDRARLRRIEEREVLDVAELEVLHPQDHAGEADPLDLRIGERRPRLEVALLVQPEAHAALGPAAPALALVGARLGDLLDEQLRHAGPHAVAIDPRQAAVDDIDDAGDGQRGLGDVGRQDHPPAGPAVEHALLLGGRQSGVQRQHRRMRDRSPLDLGQGLADLALARQEHQDVVARVHLGDLVDRVGDRVGEVLLVVARRPIDQLDRVGPARHLDHRRAAEELREPVGLERRRADDHAQVAAARQQALQEPEQEVDVEAALVGLVDDDRVVLVEQRVALDLGEQDPVGHELDVRAGLDLVVEPDLVPDDLAQLGLQLLGDARRDAGRRDPPRLGAADPAVDAAAHRQADLGQLRGLARAGLAGDDDHLVLVDRVGDVDHPRGDRQLGRERDAVAERQAPAELGLRRRVHRVAYLSRSGRRRLRPARQ